MKAKKTDFKKKVEKPKQKFAKELFDTMFSPMDAQIKTSRHPSITNFNSLRQLAQSQAQAKKK